jgi:hypothetical protein
MKFNLLIIIVFLGVLFFDQQGIEANSAPAPLVLHSKDAGQSCETVTKNQVIFSKISYILKSFLYHINF